MYYLSEFGMACLAKTSNTLPASPDFFGDVNRASRRRNTSALNGRSLCVDDGEWGCSHQPIYLTQLNATNEIENERDAKKKRRKEEASDTNIFNFFYFSILA